MSARRLEMSVDQLKSKTTSQLAELGKKTDAINRMKLELGEKNATIFALKPAKRRSRNNCARPKRSSLQDRGAADRRASADRQAKRALQDQHRIIQPFDDGR